MTFKSNPARFIPCKSITFSSASFARKFTAVITLTAFLVTGVIQDMAGFDLKKLFALPAASPITGSLENVKESTNPIQSYQTDLFTGRAQTSIPIFTPPGRRGLTPQVSLNYSSSGGNSALGVGWDLSQALIQRSTKRGVPTYNDAQDIFIFSMQSINFDLVNVGGNEYHAKDESGEFLKVIKESGSWTVFDKSGAEYTFGSSAQSRQTNSRGIFAWFLEKVKDVHGNTILYAYTQDQGEVYLSRIDYNGNETQNFASTHSVEFTLEDRPDTAFSYITSSKVTTAKRLKKIFVKVQGQMARKYNLTYEQSPYVGRSRLTQVKECGTDSTEETDGTCLPPQIFTYQNQTIGFQSAVPWPQPVSSLKAIHKGNAGLVISNFDMNGDGLPDRVRHYPEYGYATYWEVYLNEGGASFQSTPLLWGPIEGSCSPDRTRPRLEFPSDGADVEIIDLNRDGFLDRVLKGYSGYNQGGSNSWAVQYSQGFYSGSQTGFNHEVRFTAPGVPIPGGETYVRKNPMVSGWGYYATWDFVDMNADGILDRVNSPSNWNSTPWNVYFGMQDGFNSSASTWSPIELMSGHPTGVRAFPSGGATRLDLEDLNGDGLPDRIMREENEYASPQVWQVQWNKGNGFESKQSLALGSGSQSNAIRRDVGGDITWELLDVNADGLPDRIQFISYSSSYWNVYYNTGTGFTAPVSWGPIQYSTGWQHQLAIRGASGEEVTSDLLDVNGDGFLDRVFTDIPNSSPQWFVQLAYPTVPDLLSTINNGRGGVTTLEYKPSTQFDNKDLSGIYRLPFPVQVVSKVTQTDGMGNSYETNYSYKGGLYDAPTREFRGFRETTVTDARGTKTIHTFLQDEHGKGRSQKTEVRDQSDNLFSKEENTWVYDDTILPGVNFVYLQQSDQYLYDGDSTFKHTRKRFQYDTNGNLRVLYNDGDVDEITDDRVQRTEYAINPDLHILNTLSQTSSYNYLNELTSEKYFYYDHHESLTDPPAKALLTKQEDLLRVAGHETLATSMTYDDFGNVLTITDARGYTTTNEYDPTLKLYLTKVTNTLGHSQEFTYDPLIAQITEVRDQNGQTTETIYDPLGRAIKVISPYDSEAAPTQAVYYDDVTIPNRVITHVKSDADAPGLTLDENPHTGYLTTYSFMDGLGREIEKRSPAENTNQQIVSGTLTFDNRGQIDKQYVPYFADFRTTYASPPAPTPYATFTYDAVGRRTRIDFPDSTYSTVIYDDFTKTVTDPNGHSKRYTQDAFGNLAKVEEFNQGETYTTLYEYDSLNRLTRTTNHLGHITQLVYDLLGRKREMQDPNMGHWVYTYDENNNLKTQRDAKNQTITFTYDELNRLTRKTYPNGTHLDYVYDSCPPETCGGLEGENYPTGRLLKVEDFSGIQTFRYDKLGRVLQDQKSVDDGNDYGFTRIYDPLGRVKTLEYPDGEILNLTFNPMGEAESLNLLDPGPMTLEPILTNVNYNASGQITKIQYGNGVTTDYSYNPQTLRLSDLQTLAPSGPMLQQYHYEFDNVGNVQDIVDSVNTNTQHFQYDDLDRLTQATGSYGTRTYAYDAIGNMTQKGPATLEYTDPLHPQAVTRYIEGLQITTYQYDANGNMTKRGSETLQYDYDNRLIRIKEPAHAIPYPEDPTHIDIDKPTTGTHQTVPRGGGAKKSALIQKPTPTLPMQTIATYVYDASGQRVKKVTSQQSQVTNTTYYLGKDYEVEYSPQGNLTRKAFFLGEQRIAEKEIPQGEGAVSHLRFFHQDHLGSTNLVTNDLGQVTLLMEYLPYGEVKLRVGSDSVHNTFTGQKEDLESNLMYYNARYYDPKLGRFITADWIVSSPSNPQSLNRYSYCDNNPVKYTDPTGHKKKSWWKKIVKLFAKGTAYVVNYVVRYFTGDPDLGNASGKYTEKYITTLEETGDPIGANIAGLQSGLEKLEGSSDDIIYRLVATAMLAVIKEVDYSGRKQGAIDRVNKMFRKSKDDFASSFYGAANEFPGRMVNQAFLTLRELGRQDAQGHLIGAFKYLNSIQSAAQSLSLTVQLSELIDPMAQLYTGKVDIEKYNAFTAIKIGEIEIVAAAGTLGSQIGTLAGAVFGAGVGALVGKTIGGAIGGAIGIYWARTVYRRQVTERAKRFVGDS